MIRLPEIRVDSIKVSDRVRRDMGDLAALATSIHEVGLLHPIVVTPRFQLLAGGRRLEAIKLLGWEVVGVRVIEDSRGLAEQLAIEAEENTCRKDFTPSEAATMREQRADALTALAEENARANLKKGQVPPSGKVAHSEKVGRVADAATTGTGFSRRTLDKVDAVRRATDDADPVVAEAARTALVEIDRTGKVDGAFKKVADVEAAQIGGQSYADAKYVATVAKQIHLCHGLFSLDAHRVAGLADGDLWESLDRLEVSFGKWLGAVRDARPALIRRVK